MKRIDVEIGDRILVRRGRYTNKHGFIIATKLKKFNANESILYEALLDSGKIITLGYKSYIVLDDDIEEGGEEHDS